MALENFGMLIHEFLNKDSDIVPKEASLIVFDSKYSICMAKNGKDTKQTRQNARRIHFLRNGKKCKLNKIDRCEGGLKLADIDTKNVGEHDFTPRLKFIIVIIDN